MGVGNLALSTPPKRPKKARRKNYLIEHLSRKSTIKISGAVKFQAEYLHVIRDNVGHGPAIIMRTINGQHESNHTLREIGQLGTTLDSGT
jgi:hypothetical protein